jgi:hypothetical protein
MQDMLTGCQAAITKENVSKATCSSVGVGSRGEVDLSSAERVRVTFANPGPA